jgi:hypothetical protein
MFSQERQSAAINEMDSDKERIYDRMNNARARMQLQVRSDEIKSDLIDKLRLEKEAEEGLKNKVAELEKSDPQLFAYIRKLEYINTSIYCVKCDSIKNVPGFHEVQPPKVVDRTEEELAKLKEDYVRVLNDLKKLQDHIDAQEHEYMRRMSVALEVFGELKLEVENLRTRAIKLNALPQSIDEESYEIHPATPLRANVTYSTELPSMIEETEKNKPDFTINGVDIDSWIDDQYGTFTADSILGFEDQE